MYHLNCDRFNNTIFISIDSSLPPPHLKTATKEKVSRFPPVTRMLLLLRD